MYKKRDGTSGIRGQLYETKLISLIHYRMKDDKDIKDYNIASNVSDIGTFDDICIRANVDVKGVNKPVAVFIQAKHIEGDKVQITLNSKNDLAKWFSSYLTIRRLFKPSNKDALFEGEFQDLECLFIMYTTAKADPNTTEVFKSDFADKLNSWIGTGAGELDKGLQPCHKNEDIVFLCEIIMKEQFAALAVQLAKFLSDTAKDDKEDDVNINNDLIMPMQDELVLMYHVILAQKVLDLSEIKCKNEKDEHRVASFQTDFFSNDDEFIILFKDTLFIEMLRKRKLKETKLNGLLSTLCTKPLDITVLSSLIGNVVSFNDKNSKLEFVSKSMSEKLRRQLEKVYVLQSQVNAAIELAAKGLLEKRVFKVSVFFGNKDLIIRGKGNNVAPSDFIAFEIDKLKSKLVDLIEKSPTEKIIVIDETIEKEFLNLNADLSGTIGNILVSDKNSKFMKFADGGILGNLAKKLYSEVHSAIPNLHDYKFHIKVKTFPKLTFECDDDEDLETLKDQVTELAKLVGQFLCKDNEIILPMNDVMLRYHVLVALKIVEVSEIQSLNDDGEHRVANFRREFFESDDEFVDLFKKALYDEILEIRNIDENEIDLTTKEILTSRQFKVPSAFGNKDLTINIKKSKTEKRLDHLKLKISELIFNSDTNKIVTLDESLGAGLLKLNGGIAGIVGNILVSEENSKLMKFTDNWESLGELSKRLFMKLQSRVENLHDYKFDVKVNKFPKLSFKRDEDDENLAKNFLKRLLFFSNQANENCVETLLKLEIEDQCLKVDNVRVTADAIFLQYHDLIQKWWMLKNAEAPYLTKQSKYYEDALAMIVDKPLISIISETYMIKNKNNTDYTFNEKALNCLTLKDLPPATVVVTESSAFTVAKMVQSLKNIDHFVFDLGYILNLEAKDFDTVSTELTKTNENKQIIIVCNNLNTNRTKRLGNIAKVLEKKLTIFVIKESLMERIKTIFVQANNVVTDERCSLIQMSEKSQKSILENSKVLFQDVEINLDSIIDEHSMGFIEGEVLTKAINNELIVLGCSNSNSNYEKVKHLYIDRRITRVNNSGPNIGLSRSNLLLTLNDITDVALVTAKPGMGKSTLFTHLSLKTKELNPKVWIVSINLLTHSGKFSKWQKNKTNITYLEIFKLFCEILTEKQRKNNDFSIELEESNDDVTLKSCTGDQLTTFTLKMFLDYYKRKEIIFIFDGFDEICPMYTDEVLTLLTTVRNYHKKHKMWITSRSYDKIISRLEQEFGNSYEIQPFSETEQDAYMLNFWKSNFILRDLTKEQYNNLCSFMEFMVVFYYIDNQYRTMIREKHQVILMKVYFNFLSYLRKKINECPESVVEYFNTLFSGCNEKINYIDDIDTPLLLYLIAEYFQNQIKDASIIPNRWSLKINAFTVYESFIETKLMIRFQEKNKIDPYYPDNRIIYEIIRNIFFVQHCKLGAYAVFHQDADKIFSEKELREIKETIDKIKEGTEKTGLIHRVANGIPNFIHLTFAEYFAAQHLCDLLKRNQQKSLWEFVWLKALRHSETVSNIVTNNMKTDEKLKAIVSDNWQIIRDIVAKPLPDKRERDFSYSYFIIKMSVEINKSLRRDEFDELKKCVPWVNSLSETRFVTPRSIFICDVQNSVCSSPILSSSECERSSLGKLQCWRELDPAESRIYQILKHLKKSNIEFRIVVSEYDFNRFY